MQREISTLDFSQFLESRDTVVYNSDGTKFTVKYVGSSPSYTFTHPTSGPYTRDGLKSAQSESEWPHGDA